jgi:hypothetical protein
VTTTIPPWHQRSRPTIISLPAPSKIRKLNRGNAHTTRKSAPILGDSAHISTSTDDVSRETSPRIRAPRRPAADHDPAPADPNAQPDDDTRPSVARPAHAPHGPQSLDYPKAEPTTPYARRLRLQPPQHSPSSPTQVRRGPAPLAPSWRPLHQQGRWMLKPVHVDNGPTRR